MIKTILFDFDGVILDSMKIKAEGFKAIFSEYDPEIILKIEAYHYANGGMSRFEKIKNIHSSILHREVSPMIVDEYATRFAESISKHLFNKNNLIDDTVLFIKKNYSKYNLHIVSGAEHSELNKLCNIFDLEQYFITIEGSPTKKILLVKKIIDKYSYVPRDTILIGDSMNDYEAAKANQIRFYGYNNMKLKALNYIHTFSGKGLFEKI